jgi:hypothetical protein
VVTVSPASHSSSIAPNEDLGDGVVAGTHSGGLVISGIAA